MKALVTDLDVLASLRPLDLVAYLSTRGGDPSFIVDPPTRTQ